jgi:prepilin-type N-terminal cleavage/methylation domain-containing protein
MLVINGRARARSRGFTLIEIIVTIAVLAVVTSIAVPFISVTLQKSRELAARRNAQAIAGLASSASAAGNREVESAASKEDAVDLLVGGVQGEGQFSDNTFMVNLKEKDRERTLKYLEFNGETLAFDPGDE